VNQEQPFQAELTEHRSHTLWDAQQQLEQAADGSRVNSPMIHPHSIAAIAILSVSSSVGSCMGAVDFTLQPSDGTALGHFRRVQLQYSDPQARRAGHECFA